MLYFDNPAYLNLQNSQLVVRIPEESVEMTKPDIVAATIPIEDIGVVFLNHRQITITQALLNFLELNFKNTLNLPSCSCDFDISVSKIFNAANFTDVNTKVRHNKKSGFDPDSSINLHRVFSVKLPFYGYFRHICLFSTMSKITF